MNEVEKMYANAGIEKHYCSFESSDGNVYNWELNEDGEEKYNKCFLGKPKIKQRLFTAEKQLELIKLLSYYYNITISKNFENDYIFQCQGDDVRRYVFTSGQDFAEQIASFVNMCYELLPEEERKQVKGILE